VKVAAGSDHAGLAAKTKAIEVLEKLGCEVEDLGTHSESSCDYPDFALKVAERVAGGKAEAPLGHALGDALNQIGPVLDHGRELVVPGVDEPGEVRVLVHQVQRDLARADVALHVPGPVEVPRPVGVGVGTQVDRFDRHQ